MSDICKGIQINKRSLRKHLFFILIHRRRLSYDTGKEKRFDMRKEKKLEVFEFLRQVKANI